MEDSSKSSEKNEGSFNKLLSQRSLSFFVAVVTSIVTTSTASYIQRLFSHPQLTIEGVLPLHLYKSDAPIPFHTHKLALVFKVINDSPTTTIAHLGLIQGCVKPNWDIGAEYNLPKKQQIKREDIDDKRHEHTMQRISISGMVRQDSQTIPQYGTAYVGVLFPSTLKALRFLFHVVRLLQARAIS